MSAPEDGAPGNGEQTNHPEDGITPDSPISPRLERRLADVLYYGTGVASAIIAAGLALALIDFRAGTHNLAILPNMQIVTAGIALFIFLPVLRVMLMLIAFLRERDYRLSAVAAFVLLIIFLGLVLGMRLASVSAG